MPWFRVAVEGATTDGRTISRDWIKQMAENFDPAKYGARVWMEHMRGLFHDGPFAALGDVTAAKSEEQDGKLGLYVQLDPTDRLKQMNKERQKVYTSIEVDPDFAGSGEAYLVGLAVTDSPASLGTEMLQFSAQQGSASPLAGRKQKPDNVFSAAVETALDFSAPPSDSPPAEPSLLEKVKGLFTKHDAKTSAGFSAFRTELEQTLELFVQKHLEMEDQLSKRADATAFAELKTAHDELKTRFEALYTKLDNEPAPRHQRPAAIGGDGDIVTDC